MQPALVAALVAALASSPAFAQQKEKAGSSNEVHRAMMSSAKQSQSMKPSGDVDQDFVTMMRHHHQGGIRMAEAELRHGRNDEVKALAKKILEGQKQELAELEKLAKPAAGAQKR